MNETVFRHIDDHTGDFDLPSRLEVKSFPDGSVYVRLTDDVSGFDVGHSVPAGMVPMLVAHLMRHPSVVA